MSESTFVAALRRAEFVVPLAILESKFARVADGLNEFKREAAREEWAAWAERQARMFITLLSRRRRGTTTFPTS